MTDRIVLRDRGYTVCVGTVEVDVLPLQEIGQSHRDLPQRWEVPPQYPVQRGASKMFTDLDEAKTFATRFAAAMLDYQRTANAAVERVQAVWNA